MLPFLALRFFSVDDFYLVPICIIFLFVFVRYKANRQIDPEIKKLYYQAFWYRVFFVFSFAFISEVYFGGGDTGLYYQGVKDLRTAISEDANNGYLILQSSTLNRDNPLAPYFLYDHYTDDITFNYMKSASNFFMPRLALIPSLLFGNNFICIALLFSFFAMGGAIRLFKTFYYYYPALRREIAISTLFLPSVAFWSAGLLKDTICFGCVGFIVYAIFNLFVRRKKYGGSIIVLIICGYLLYTIKTYIFLVLLLALFIWIFAETNKHIKDKTLRQVFAVMTFTVAIGIGFFLVQFFTSSNTLKQYQLENIVTSAEYQRRNYEFIDQGLNQQTSYYSVNSSNPVSLVLNSIVATFFRPFPFEVKSAAAVLSAIEALAFLLLTIHLFLSKNAGRRFRLIFKDPRILMCFVFAIVFAIGVGASTANFGALSRYKIPCLPFYMLMLLILYKNTGLRYPAWFRWVLKKTKKS